MGLGKTVEVLSLLLCNPRPHVPKPEWLEPVKVVEKEPRKRRRRARSPSPVEFTIEEVDSGAVDDGGDGDGDDDDRDDEDYLVQLDGNQSGSDENEDSGSNRKTRKRVSFNVS